MLDLLFSGSWTTTILIGVGTALFVYWLIKKLRYNYPPGPWCPPLVGHLLQVNMKTLPKEVIKWSKTYGPVVTVHLGPFSMVFINKIEPALEVLVKKSTDFANRFITTSIDLLTYGGKDITFSNYGPTWKLHRRIASKALRHYMQGQALERHIHDALKTAFVELDKQIGEVFDNTEYINFTVTNILTGLCFGGKYLFDDKDVSYILKVDEELFLNSNGCLEDLIPPFRHVYKTQTFRKFEEFAENVIENFIGTKYREAQKTFKRDTIRHFTDNLILAKLEAEEEEESKDLESLTDAHILQTITNIFFAGIDTSRLTLRYAILHMIAFPEIQEKVQKEIDAVVGKDRLPEMDDRPNLAYTEAVLHESMRMGTVSPTGIMHCTMCDTDVSGYNIPKGTVVVINHFALHTDTDEWEEPRNFKPERYLADDGKLGPKPRSWLPFSAGKRVCLGEFVAKPELHLIFAALMQRYTWKAEPGTIPDIEGDMSFMANPPKPYKCIIEKRV